MRNPCENFKGIAKCRDMFFKAMISYDKANWLGSKPQGERLNNWTSQVRLPKDLGLSGHLCLETWTFRDCLKIKNDLSRLRRITPDRKWLFIGWSKHAGLLLGFFCLFLVITPGSESWSSFLWDEIPWYPKPCKIWWTQTWKLEKLVFGKGGSLWKTMIFRFHSSKFPG